MESEARPAVRRLRHDSVGHPRHLAYIGIGSNKGERFVSCCRAVQKLASDEQVRVSKISSLYETAPMCVLDQNRFYNAVIEIETTLTPHQLLVHSQKIEHQIGKKAVIPKGPREIDLDLLFYDQEVIDEPNLIIPHPHISERRFVLVPMVEIAPGTLHPVLGQRVETLLYQLNEKNDSMVIITQKRGWEEGRL